MAQSLQLSPSQKKGRGNLLRRRAGGSSRRAGAKASAIQLELEGRIGLKEKGRGGASQVSYSRMPKNSFGPVNVQKCSGLPGEL